VDVTGLRLATAWAFVQDQLRLAAPGGRLDLAMRYRFAYGDRQATLGLEAIRARVSALELGDSAGGPPVLALETIAASDARFDLASRELVVPRIEVTGGRAVVARGADGRIALVETLAAVGGPAGEPGARARPAEAPGARPWKVMVEALELRGVEMALADRGYAPPITYDCEVVSATLRGLASDGSAPARFEAALRVRQGGTVQGKGTLAAGFRKVEAQVEVKDVALAPLRPWLAHHATLDLRSGQASASARVSYQTGGEGPPLRATGSVSLDDVLVNETETGERFLAWKTMATDDVTLTLAPGRLQVGEVRLTEPGAKVVIARDRSLNLTHVLKTGGSPAAAPAPPPGRPGVAGAPPPASREPDRDAFHVHVARVSVRDGTVDFADLSLVLPFSTRISRFGGAAVGISTERAARTEVRFRGRIAPAGAARIEGGLSAFDPTAFTDIRAEFDNVEMPPLSPYTVTFAGRKVAAGRLSLDLRYKMVDGALTGQSDVVMHDFALGDRVEAPNALDLPLDLAVALLTDSEGRIRVAVPIRGDAGHPQFDLRHLVREAIGNLIRRVVSAPFRVLGRLFGAGDEEQVGTVEFDPGSARLRPPEREKLDKVAQVLRERPQLKLVVHGPFDPERDGEALRHARVRREVAQALGGKSGQRGDPGPIAYSDAATQRVLETMLAARLGSGGADALARAFRQETGRDPERVSRVLALFGRASPDREFYQAVFRRLVEVYPLPEGEPQLLATRRAEAIIDHLTRSAGVEPGRIETGDVRAVSAPPDQAIAARLALDVRKSS
jgi:hypothetical protein